MDSNTSFHTKKYPSTIQYILGQILGGMFEKFTKNSHLKYANTHYRTKFLLYIRSFFSEKLLSVHKFLQKNPPQIFLQRILGIWRVFKFVSNTNNTFDVTGHIWRDFQLLPHIADMVVNGLS